LDVKFQEYESLEQRNKRKETDNPEVEEYFKARELFTKGFEIASKVPEDSEEETLRAHEHEILESTKYLVEAFLVDDRATEMSPRIMSLAQQYEKLIKLTYDGADKKIIELDENDVLGKMVKANKVYPPQDDPDHLTRESLILVIWLLFNGKQYQFCIQTLTIALTQLESKLHPRLHHIRALCYLATEDYKNCIKDLDRLLLLDHNFVDSYCIQGFICMSQDDRLEAARHFKTFIERANKDSAYYSYALYALTALNGQNATSLTTGNRNHVTQNLRNQQAYAYYQKAKEAEKRYEYLYGHAPDLSYVKRTAMTLFEQKGNKENKEITKLEKDSKKEAERLAPILQKFFSESQQSSAFKEKKCNSCGSQTRKDLNGKLDAEKKSNLLICTGCSNVNYCSKECQKKDWKNGHKKTCTTAKSR